MLDMLARIVILVVLGALAGGCVSEQMPQIVGEAPSLKPVKVQQTNPWQPPANVEKGWKAIVVHHSATPRGDAASIDKWHREVNHWDGIGYDFVIGNGTYTGDGSVEVTFRWEKQIPGAHCGGTENNWANVDGIGICLIGDFNQTEPSASQMKSLVELTRYLQERYKIPTSQVYGHRDVPGGHQTDCPGNNFPMAEFKAKLGGA
jgi:hypothetical protein